MRHWGRSRVMEGATALASAPRRGLSASLTSRQLTTRQLTTTISALQFVYDRTHAGDGQAPPAAAWSFLSDHARVLMCLAEGPDRQIRDVAATAGVPEADVARIVGDLVAEGYLRRRDERSGRPRYEVDPESRLRHPIERGARLGDVLAVWGGRA